MGFCNDDVPGARAAKATRLISFWCLVGNGHILLTIFHTNSLPMIIDTTNSKNFSSVANLLHTLKILDLDIRDSTDLEAKL